MAKQHFEYFLNAGIKINPIDFTVLPILEDPDQESVRLTDIPTWDIGEIIEYMGDDERERFLSLLMRAVRSLPNAS